MKLSLVQAHSLAAAVGGIAMALSIVSGVAGWDYAPQPFVWRDVALVCFLAALPVAASLAAVLLGHVRFSQAAAVVLLEVAALVIVPRLYSNARCRSDAARVADLVEQSRVGEAQQLARRVLLLRPDITWNSVPLRDAAARMGAMVNEVERRVASKLPASASDEQRLGRARELAMLGRTDISIALLESSPTLLARPDACNLRGTIHETRNQWQTARLWYARAKDAWQSHGDTPEAAAGKTHAVRGTAYCERKLGRLPQAEAAYQELLTLAPSADTHFLLAQFYEDTQQATSAQAHARQAMALDPQHYAQRGQKLIDKLITLHFGCWGAYAAERSLPSSVGTKP